MCTKEDLGSAIVNKIYIDKPFCYFIFVFKVRIVQMHAFTGHIVLPRCIECRAV